MMAAAVAARGCIVSMAWRHLCNIRRCSWPVPECLSISSTSHRTRARNSACRGRVAEANAEVKTILCMVDGVQAGR